MSVPSVNTGRVKLSGSLWPGLFETAPGDAMALLCSHSAGWTAGVLPERVMAPDVTVMAVDDGGTVKAFVVRGNKDTFETELSLDVDLPTSKPPDICHCSHSLSFFSGNEPGAVFLGKTSTPGAAWDLVAYNYQTITGQGLTSKSVVSPWWDNELGRNEGELRIVDYVPGNTEGPWMVTFGPSSTGNAGDLSFYLRKLKETPSSDPALEILIDPKPTDILLPDMTRFQAVGLEDGTIVFYYRVFDTNTGFQGTACMMYDPSKNQTEPTAPGPYNRDGLKLKPTFLFPDMIPTTSRQGVSRHPITGEIILALEDVSATTGKQLRFASTRGNGLVLDATHLVFDEDTHPHLFGGRWKSVCPNAVIDLDSIGWTDNGLGSSFIIMAGFVSGSFSEVHKDFINALDPASTNGETVRRPLYGELAVKRPEEIAGDGDVTFLDVNSAPWHASENSRQGYSLTSDLGDAVLLMRFAGIDSDDVSTVVGPSATSASTLPGPGIIGTGRVFFDELESIITVDGSDTSFDEDDLSVSLWLFPQDTPTPGDHWVIGKPRGASSASWSIRYNDSTNVLSFQYTSSGTNTVTSGTYTLPVGFWYHVTATYDSATDTGRLYVFGNLVGESTAVTGALVHTAGGDVVLGDADQVDASLPASFVGRVDDVMVGSAAMPQNHVILAFAEQLNSPTGPVFTSHRKDQEDHVVETAISNERPLARTSITVTAREVNVHGVAIAAGNMTSWIVYEVWRREKGTDPVYLGVLPSPPLANDFVNSGTAGASYNPRITGRHRLNPTLTPHPTTNGKVVLWHGLVHDTTDVANIFRTEFDPDDIADTVANVLVASLDMSGAFEFCPGMAVVPYSTDHAVFVTRYDFTANASGTIYAIRPTDFGFGAIGAAPSSSFTSMMPSSDLTHGNTDWNASWSEAGEEVFMCGIAGFQTSAGMGFDLDIFGAAPDIMLLYGVATRGVAAAPFDANQVMGTTAAGILISDLDVGTFTAFNPGQVDEYGHGGIQPFCPIRVLKPIPDKDSAPQDWGDTLILGSYGTRPALNNMSPGGVDPPIDGERRGNSGLCVLKADTQGWWGLKRVCTVPLDGVPSLTSHHHGADMARMADTIIAGGTEYTVEDVEDPYFVVSKPHVDGADRASTVYLTPDEATAAGWATITSGAVIPVLHPTSEPFTCVWQDIKINTRNFTTRVTGSRIVRTGLNQVQPLVHWLAGGDMRLNALGEAIADSKIQNVPAFQGGSYQGDPVNVTRFWHGDPTGLRIGIGSKNFRTPTTQRKGTFSLGTVGEGLRWPVGIIDNVLESLGLYYYLESSPPYVLKVVYCPYDASALDTAGGNCSIETAWSPSTFTLPEGSHRGMRIVKQSTAATVVAPENTSGTPPLPDTYCYFIFGTATKSQIMYVKLPYETSPAPSASTEDPSLVAALDFVADDRVYVVPNRDGTMTIYVGDSGSSSARRTTVMVHNPKTNELVRPPKVVFNGATPFPQSYAAVRTRRDNGLESHIVMLEPSASRDGSAGQLVPSSFDVDVPKTGNQWLLATFVTDGYFLLESGLITPNDVIPHWAESQVVGGRFKNRVVPHALSYVRTADERDLMYDDDVGQFEADPLKAQSFPGTELHLQLAVWETDV